MKIRAFFVLIVLLLLSCSACNVNASKRKPYTFREDLHMEDYLDDPLFQEDYSFLLQITPSPPDVVCDDAAYRLLYFYRAGTIEEGYPYPTVDDMRIQSAVWEEHTVSSNGGSSRYYEGTLSFETCDEKEYVITYINQVYILFECVTDKTVIEYRPR